VDLATNKVLAMTSRRVIRDWVDCIHCHQTVQPLGYLAWAAAGKDVGLSPSSIVEEAARSHYVQEELERVDFEGPAPDAAQLTAVWRQALADARKIVLLLPPDEVGKVVFAGRDLARFTPEELPKHLGDLSFHQGRVRGAFPEIRELPSAAQSAGRERS
jgi:hypothetical protein